MRCSKWSVGFLSMISLLLSSCGPTHDESPSEALERWNRANDPSILVDSYTVRLSSLPFSGRAAHTPWTDSYWPANRGGLAARWQQTKRDGFSYQVHDFMTILSMSPHQIAALSPAEKYDIYRGDMTYSLVRAERVDNQPFEADWAGICHGWAAASVNMQEPRAVTLTSPQGIVVPFGAADVKALVAYAHTVGKVAGDTKVLGQRCDVDARTLGRRYHLPECRDTNAGSFHVVLANMVGLQRRPFIIDSVASKEVWNHPVFAFRATILREMPLYVSAAPTTTKVLRMRTEIDYVVNTPAAWQSDRFAAQSTARKVYEYTLEMDRDGNIVGGEWLQDDRPDFLWMQNPPQRTELTKDVETIYRASLRAR